MARKLVDENARMALNQMKIECSNEIGANINHIDNGANMTSESVGGMCGYVGGMMTRKLIEMGEKELINKYNNNNMK